MIPVGVIAPDFTLPDQHNGHFRLSALRGRANVLLLFIPAAFTPICSTELPALAKAQAAFWREAHTVVAAITADHSPCNRAWLRELGLGEVSLLSDFEPKGQVSRAYGSWLPADGIPDRGTVIVGKDGRVRYAESVGKFGKRSIPALLQIARAIDGRVSTAPPTARMPLDLPVLLISGSCPNCQIVLGQVRQMRLEGSLVIRDVEADAEASSWLTSLRPDRATPVLRYQNNVYVGAPQILQVLPRFVRQRAA